MMLRRSLLVVSLGIAILAVLRAWRTPPETPTRVPGRNNTVLFLTSEASGLSNVHVAASSALLEFHPHVEVHYASFSRLESKISRISSAARAKNPAARSIQWHELPGPGLLDVIFSRRFENADGLVRGLGAKDFQKKVEDLVFMVAPYEADEHWDMFQAISELVEEIDPSLIVLDNAFVPAMDFARNTNRSLASISPNGLLELIAEAQPWAAMFWKYPAIYTGFPFPVPWKTIPINIFMSFRLIWDLVNSPVIASKRALLAEKGMKSPLELQFVLKDVPLLLSTIPEVNFPMSYFPSNIKLCGPITLETAPAHYQDPEVAEWIAQAPTVLVNLGSLFQWNEQRTRAMADAIAVLLADTNVQVLWKFYKLGDYSDEVFSSAQKYLDSGRLQIKTWLEADPASLLNTGHIVLSVHHGGANSYHEAVLAGVPQMILPLWMDTFSIANAAEYSGIGVWPGKDITPEWTTEALIEGFRTALTGPTSTSLTTKAQEIAEVAKQYGGRQAAAAELARLAAAG